jgi:hypothetical protein
MAMAMATPKPHDSVSIFVQAQHESSSAAATADQLAESLKVTRQGFCGLRLQLEKFENHPEKFG